MKRELSAVASLLVVSVLSAAEMPPLQANGVELQSPGQAQRSQGLAADARE